MLLMFQIMATDGLWDVTSNETAVTIVKQSLSQFSRKDKSRSNKTKHFSSNMLAFMLGVLDCLSLVAYTLSLDMLIYKKWMYPTVIGVEKPSVPQSFEEPGPWSSEICYVTIVRARRDQVEQNLTQAPADSP